MPDQSVPVPPLQTLLSAYEKQLGNEELATGGRPLVGLVGAGIPEEPILAAGATPVQVFPQPGEETPVADQHLNADESPVLRSLLDKLAGTYRDRLSLAVIGAPFANLSVMIEELRRDARLPGAVPCAYFEMMAVQTEENRRYSRDRTADLTRRLGLLAGEPISREALASAIEATNRRRRVVSKFIAARRESASLTGTEAYQALGAHLFLRPETHADLLSDVLDRLEPRPYLRARPRILIVPSSPLTHAHAHRVLEEAGALVVAEDDPFGARAAPGPIPVTDDPLTAISDFYFENRTGERVYPASSRLGWFYEEAGKPDIDGVVFYVQEPKFGWDIPAMREFLDAAGKPSLLAMADARTASGREKLKTLSEPFIAGLSAGRAR